MKGQNLGAGLAVLNRFWDGFDLDEEYGSAMGAPMGELRPLINRSAARRFRFIKRQIKSITGLKFDAFSAEVERRTSSRFVYFRTPIGREMSLRRELP